MSVAGKSLQERVIEAYASTEANAQAMAFALVGTFVVVVKWIVLSKTTGFLVASRALGLASVDDLSILQRLTFWREDFLVDFVLIPGLLPVVLYLVWPRGARYVAATLAMAMTLVVYVAMVSVGNVGTYLNVGLLVDAVKWGLDDPSLIHQYVGAKGFGGLCTLSTGILVLCIFPNAIIRIPFGAQFVASRAILIIVLLGLTGVLAASVGDLPRIRQHQAQLVSIVAALAEHDTDAGVIDQMSNGKVELYFRTQTNTPEWVDSAYFGKEEGSDVLIFVLETGPQRSFALSGGLESLPTLARLAERSFVASQHYSTYPYTSDAVFSIFSGLYPVGVRTKVASSRTPLSQALPNQLVARGYTTGRYAYSDTFEADAQTFRNMGMHALYEGDRPPPGAIGVHPQAVEAIYQRFGSVPDDERADTERKLNIDLTSLAKLEADMATFTQESSRYLAAYFPIIGHGPWPDFGGQKETVRKGRRIMEFQDAWLGEVVALLESKGRLEHTIIVVTADHGIRTVAEDRNFEAGTINSYSFGVPLLIFAPNSLRERVTIAVPTSHVDITPTILDLLGVKPIDPGGYQGVPIYSAELARRQLFFLAGGYLGADGFLMDDVFKMRANLTGLTFANHEMTFPLHTVVSDPTIGEKIDDIYRIQARWARMVLEAPDEKD